jgi:glycosyltransferase involved in cell wall biosynthesis
MEVLMSDPIPVTVVILTLNEEANLSHCINSLSGFDQIVVVDSFSSDKTEEISRASGAEFYQHVFTGFGDQRNWVLEQIAMRNDWVLVLDADERVPVALANEINRLVREESGIGAYKVRRRFYMWGRWLRYSSLYPTWVVRLIRKEKVRYRNRGHSETQVVEGTTAELQNDLIDENHKGIDDWIIRQVGYAEKEAIYELNWDREPLRLSGLWSTDALERRHALKRLSSRMPARALIYFLYSYLVRFGFLDGADGFRFCLLKAFYHHMIVIKKLELGSK